jgi:hypothetical protein
MVEAWATIFLRNVRTEKPYLTHFLDQVFWESGALRIIFNDRRNRAFNPISSGIADHFVLV